MATDYLSEIMRAVFFRRGLLRARCTLTMAETHNPFCLQHTARRVSLKLIKACRFAIGDRSLSDGVRMERIRNLIVNIRIRIRIVV